MKKYAAMLLSVSILISLAACAAPAPAVTGTSASAKPSSSAPVSTAPAASPSAASPAEQFLATEPTAAALGSWLRLNVNDLAPKDGDKLLERLLLLQMDVSTELNSKLWTDDYLSALNGTLGGTLDASKIENIKNEAVRADYMRLSDSLMTVVRYEETPAAEADWPALLALKKAFSPGTAGMLELESHVSGGFYGSSVSGLDKMASDIAAVEKALPAVQGSFVHRQLKELYARLVEKLIFGPEGEYLGDFISGKQETLDRLSKYLKQYGDTRFGGLCMTLLNMQSAESQAVSDAVAAAVVFGPDDQRHIEYIDTDVNGVPVTYPAVRGDKNTAAADGINAAIRSAAEELAKVEAAGQRIFCNTTVSGSFLSVTLSGSTTRPGGETGYMSKYLNFDLTTGKQVPLDYVVGGSLSDFKSALLKAMQGQNVPADIKAPVDFTLTRDGLGISIPRDGDIPDSYDVTLNGLRSFMDITKLY